MRTGDHPHLIFPVQDGEGNESVIKIEIKEDRILELVETIMRVLGRML